jgi:tetratricopeptide (TPR) repeat protein
MGKFEEAIQAYDYALLIDDSFASAYFNLGNALMNTNQFEEALEAYQNTINCEGEQCRKLLLPGCLL